MTLTGGNVFGTKMSPVVVMEDIGALELILGLRADGWLLILSWPASPVRSQEDILFINSM
jgi:hypothetical protein